MRNTAPKFHQILDIIPGHVYWKDLNGVYLGCNLEQARALGFKDAKGLIGKTDFDISPYDLAKAFSRVDHNIIKSKKPLITEETVQNSDGSVSEVLSHKLPMYDDEGNVAGIIGVSLDITDRKKKEELIKQQQFLQKQIESLELVANTLAHELRTPIGSINTAAMIANDILETDINDVNDLQNAKQELSDMLASIKRQAKQAQTFMSIILENAKDIENLNLSPISMVNPIQAAIDDFPYSVSQHQQLIHFDNKNDFTIQGDEHLLKHVILNLMKNALFFIQKNNKGEIFISLQEKDDQIQLIFEDTAEGVEPDQLPNLFENYYTKTGVGTGIGLGFCKRVVKAFDGHIRCESVKDEYMRFIMTFPKI